MYYIYLSWEDWLMAAGLQLWWPGDIRWSSFRDWQASDATVREAIEASLWRGEFQRVLGAFAARANRHEAVTVGWWHAPYVYVQVVDARLHDPCGTRALVSFDLARGGWASYRSPRRNAFARRGWGAFMDGVAGRADRVAACDAPARPGSCPPQPCRGCLRCRRGPAGAGISARP
jgi:hypothetical protein